MVTPITETLTFARRRAGWGLTTVPRDEPRASRLERRWRWPQVGALAATIPAFYAELLQTTPAPLAPLAYLLCAAVITASLLHVARRTARPAAHLLANPVDLILVPALLLAALAPPSSTSGGALALRLAVAFGTLLRMVWTMRHLITRGSVTYLLLVAVIVLGLCGMGFWWLEPTTHSLADGLWLAFTTAATVGYGDVVPTTAASKIFSVFVVLLGYGVLSLVTAAIAAHWVETEERRIEREILHDMRREIAGLRSEIHALTDAFPTPRNPQSGELRPGNIEPTLVQPRAGSGS